MKNQKVLYGIIIAFCVVAIISGIYAQFFVKDKNQNKNNIEENNVVVEEKTQEETERELLSKLTNKLNNLEYKNENIKKIKNEENFVYTYKTINKKTDKYEININLPMINIDEEIPNKFNKITKDIFEAKANSIVNNENIENTILNTKYSANIKNNILSVIIEVTLKEGNKPQQVAIQTYNYNLETKQEAKFLDILSSNEIIQSDAKNKILKTIKEEKKKADVLAESGYLVYDRDLDDKKYILENINNYFIDEQNNIYAIFAYGNQIRTSEKDIVVFENKNKENGNKENSNNEINNKEENTIKNNTNNEERE